MDCYSGQYGHFYRTAVAYDGSAGDRHDGTGGRLRFHSDLYRGSSVQFAARRENQKWGAHRLVRSHHLSGGATAVRPAARGAQGAGAGNGDRAHREALPELSGELSGSGWIVAVHILTAVGDAADACTNRG